jgi:hypothetical protein
LATSCWLLPLFNAFLARSQPLAASSQVRLLKLPPVEVEQLVSGACKLQVEVMNSGNLLCFAGNSLPILQFTG